MSKEVADGFVEALRKLEENEDVEALVELHTGDCEVGNVSVPGIFRGHEGLREFWRSYRSTFGEMRSEFRNVFATEEGAALEWTTQGTSNGDSIAYDGVSILEIEGGKVRRFMAYFDTRDLTPKSWTDGVKLAARPNGLTYSRILRNRCLLLDRCPLV
jgi:ketosteroid isomerase-like protein